MTIHIKVDCLIDSCGWFPVLNKQRPPKINQKLIQSDTEQKTTTIVGIVCFGNLCLCFLDDLELKNDGCKNPLASVHNLCKLERCEYLNVIYT